jgi:putrescine transport system permease protein
MGAKSQSLLGQGKLCGTQDMKKPAKLNIWSVVPTPKCLLLAVPYGWLLLFFLLPFLIVFKISFAEAQIAIPPYSELLSYAEQQLQLLLNIGNYQYLIEDDLYASSYIQSIRIAFVSTVMCLIIGFPIAWAIVHSTPSTRNVLLMLIILPSWTSFLIRVYAWIGILKNNGLLNNVLMMSGVIDEPLQILHTDTAVYIGIIYTYLPFMVLPLYTALMRVDYSLLEAASDLGAKPMTTLFTVLVPLTRAGVIAGSMLVFIPAVGEFVIPELLGGPDTVLIGKVLWQEFFNNRDWPVASAVAIVMLLILMLPILWFHRYQKRELEAQG